MSKVKKYRYRYRDSGRSTRDSLKRVDKHLQKVGKVGSVKGYRIRTRRSYNADEGRYHYVNSHECVLVKGKHGTARFEGFCWGYNGEGPRGLVELLTKVGLEKSKAENIAFSSRRGNDYETVTEWEVFV